MRRETLQSAPSPIGKLASGWVPMSRVLHEHSYQTWAQMGPIELDFVCSAHEELSRFWKCKYTFGGCGRGGRNGPGHEGHWTPLSEQKILHMGHTSNIPIRSLPIQKENEWTAMTIHCSSCGLRFWKSWLSFDILHPNLSPSKLMVQTNAKLPSRG